MPERRHDRQATRPRPSRRARRALARSRGHGSPPGFRPIASTDLSLTSSIRAGTTSFLPRSTRSRWAWSRQNMLSFFERGDQPLGVLRVEGEGRGLDVGPDGDDPVDPAVGLVAERGLVGVPLAGPESPGRGVVLDDEAVPVADPDRAVGADLGGDGRGPLVVAGERGSTRCARRSRSPSSPGRKSRPGGRSARRRTPCCSSRPSDRPAPCRGRGRRRR